ncbi:hypothetical protein CAC42_5648 [Sphaceloma murrayae]|uniref:Protein phosphatase methylesterase 1 n=1 Tax=Sphaceloma murrayae TaxID=2082308 RepID=A0A2K1QYR8_9PEZI|nr:hypothetical protein CAC42_5648 [Sphaceloma murrayae]
MSDMLRALPSIKERPVPLARPPPNVLTPARDRSSSDTDPDASSSDSSASTIDSINTLKPSESNPQTTSSPSISWSSYFAQELHLPHETSTHKAQYHCYFTPPASTKTGPLFICHHGAGASAMSFAPFAASLRTLMPSAGILSLSAREHGSTITTTSPEAADPDFSIPALVSDALTTINLLKSHLSWSDLPPTVFIGHSLGGVVATHIASSASLGPSLIGFLVLDVVEGSALEALAYMKTYLASRPARFDTVPDAVDWHVRSRVLRDPAAAAISVPSLLTRLDDGGWGWRTDLSRTQTWWEDWFKGMSGLFLRGRAAKGLVLAGTDRLDKELMVGQMQGRFQLTVLPEAGHFVHEDCAEKMAGLAVEFFRRNDRSQMVLPPKVGELLAMGKKV